METVTISSKYQVVIPREIREQFIPYNNTLRVVVVEPIEKVRGSLKGIRSEGIREEIDEER